MNSLFKAGAVAITLLWGSAAWAQQCGGGFMDAQGMCHNTSMGSVPMGTQGVGGSYPSNGGSSGYSYPAAPALRSSFGAVAWNYTTGTYGYSSKQASRQASKQAALADCGEKGCKVTTWYSNQCVAVGFGSQRNGRGYSADAFSVNPREAEQKALKACSSKASNCKVIVSECSLPS